MKAITKSLQNRTRLSELSRGAKARILAFDAADVEMALINLGVIPGAKCRLTNVSPFGGPIAFDINGTKVAMRKQDARCVWVYPED
jgi:ferrous iron transport protein A